MIIGSSDEVELLRNTLGAETNGQVKQLLVLFKASLLGFLVELIKLLETWERSHYLMLLHWMRDEDKRSMIKNYLEWIGLSNDEPDETVLNTAIGDLSFGELFIDYLLTSTDVVPIGDQIFDLAEQIAGSAAISRFHECRLAQGHTLPREVSETLFCILIEYDHIFRERQFRRWRTMHKKTVKFGKQAVQSGKKALSSVTDCSKMNVWTEAAEVFVGGVESVQKHTARMKKYEQMINNDLKTMGLLLGVKDGNTFKQLPLADREKVFDKCNRFRLHKSEDPEAAEE